MNISHFNLALLLGWLLVLAGGVVINPGAGLLGAGLLLIILALVVSRIAGLYSPRAEKTPGDPE